jgi:hypothetical protein
MGIANASYPDERDNYGSGESISDAETSKADDLGLGTTGIANGKQLRQQIAIALRVIPDDDDLTPRQRQQLLDEFAADGLQYYHLWELKRDALQILWKLQTVEPEQ